MKVRDLVKELEKIDPNADIYIGGHPVSTYEEKILIEKIEEFEKESYLIF